MMKPRKFSPSSFSQLLFLFVSVLFILQACAQEPVIIELSDNQSMSITGKGQGQDAVENPFDQQSSIAVMENVGRTSLTIRIEKSGKIIDLIQIHPKEIRKIELEEGYQLFLDSKYRGKATVHFEKRKGKS